MPDLKLIAFDREDLSVVAAHLQDAVLKVGDMTFLPGEKRFAAIARRFDWWRAVDEKQRQMERRQCGLRFERVLGAKVTGLDLKNRTEVLALLTVTFEANAPDDPAGIVTLYFSGGGAVRLEVECLEAELKDLGPAWRAGAKPQHSVDAKD